jgi:DNA-binding CsgD family transcriptional regulator
MDFTNETQDIVRPSRDTTTSHTSDRRLACLTPRELEITRLVSFGETSKSIGRALGISFRTVETYRARVIAKLGTRTRAELVMLTMDQWPEFFRRPLAESEIRRSTAGTQQRPRQPI